ncbi:flagellar hook-length control protein FliK [Caulobacter sp.]|uniref:flagellar hook-length control protein FliK n=1 Tax=Caulobacter sp. TaxID=78 RepID=UPI001608C390
MAIDPTTPLTSMPPTLPVGKTPDAVAMLQSMARQAIANTTQQLSEIVGRPPATLQPSAPIEEVGQAGAQIGNLDTSQTKAAPQAPVQGAVVRDAQESLMARAVRVAAAEAAPRQAGLAPLMANVRAVIERPDTPTPVREAGRALLASAPPITDLTTPQGLRRAVERSGAFLEANMARASATPAAEAQSRPTDMKAALLVFRGALSAWLGKAPIASGAPAADAPATAPDAEAELPTSSQVTTSAKPVAPQTVQTAQRAQAGTPPTSANAATPQGEAEAPQPALTPPTAAEPKAVEAAPRPPPGQTPPPEDEALEARFGAFVAAPKTAPTIQQPVRAALSALVQLGLIAEEAVAPETSDAPAAEPKALVPRGYGAPAETTRSSTPPPPYAGGPMAGQKPAAMSLASDLPIADAVRNLLKATGGALARQDLMQIASLPDGARPDADGHEVRQQGARLNLDLPFVTPQGVAVAQFEIGHDGGGSGGYAGGPIERTYKARFSIDLEPMGPVHALVTLTGSRTRVSLWAERAETIARLRAGEEVLGAALREAELTPEVAVHSGAPSVPGSSPLGHFVDQAS